MMTVLFFRALSPARLASRPPVAEAEYKDKDGVTVHLTVFASDVSLLEIDIHKQDGSRITEPLDPKRLDVFWPPEPGKKGWWEQ
jgi:hypothetical protein